MAQVGVDIGSYTFDASAKTITFIGVGLTTIEQIKPIINGTRNTDIFNPLTVGKFGTLAGQVLTLDFDTTLQADTDKLYICVNLVDAELATESTQELNRLQLVDLNSKDFSTAAKQDLAKAVLDLIKAKTDNLDVALSSRNLEATQLLVKDAIDTLNLKDFATQTTLLTILSKTDFEARINTLGQKTAANSTPVVLPSDQTINVNFTDSYIGLTGIDRTPIRVEVGETVTIPINMQQTYKDNIQIYTNLGTLIVQGVMRFDNLSVFKNQGVIRNSGLIII